MRVLIGEYVEGEMRDNPPLGAGSLRPITPRVCYTLAWSVIASRMRCTVLRMRGYFVPTTCGPETAPLLPVDRVALSENQDVLSLCKQAVSTSQIVRDRKSRERA